jgi:hypothetical protein
VLVGCFVAAGVAIRCMETAEHAAIAVAAPAQLRGSAFGLLAAIQSLGNLAASAIAGLLWTAVSPEVAFAYLDGALPDRARHGPGAGPYPAMIGCSAASWSGSKARVVRVAEVVGPVALVALMMAWAVGAGGASSKRVEGVDLG